MIFDFRRALIARFAVTLTLGAVLAAIAGAACAQDILLSRGPNREQAIL